MEELTASLASSFEITKEPNKTSAPHPRFAQYKQKNSSSDQDSRRQSLLEVQKKNRFNFMSYVRKLGDDDWNADDNEYEDEEKKVDETDEESMEVEVKLKKPGRFYKDQLMLSEWLVEVPTDFKTEWITVLCPVAKRCLVVASRGKTKVYTRSGYCLNSFPSHLPGGCHKNKARDTTVLDCLYHEATSTYFILDLMCWNGHPVYDSETEFRFFWLQGKILEFPQLETVSKINPYKFIALPKFKCEPEEISTAVASASFEIDGLLFFHKRTHYTFGATPLVVWLKPFMLQEILGISVPDSQMKHMPEGYTNYSEHMKKVEENREKYKKQQQQPQTSKGRGRGRGRGQGRGKGSQRDPKDCEMETVVPPDDSLEEEECKESDSNAEIKDSQDKGMEVLAVPS